MQTKEFKQALLKEASRLPSIHPDFRTDGIVKQSMLQDGEIKLLKIKRRASLNKIAMAYFAGMNTSRNSNIRWYKRDLTPNMENVDQQLYAAFKPYFYGLIHEGGGNKQLPLNPPPLVLRYEGVREMFPIGKTNDEKSMRAEKTARTAVDLVNEKVPGFLDFATAIENSGFPLTTYFYPGPKPQEQGGLRKNVNKYGTQSDKNFPTLQKAFQDFVTNERNRLSKEPRMRHHYAQHANEPIAFPSDNSKSNRFYPKSDIMTQTKPANLVRAIKNAYRLQHRPDKTAIDLDIKKLEQDALNTKSGTDPRLITKKFTGKSPTTGQYYRTSVTGRIKLFLDDLEGGQNTKNVPKLRLNELRIIAQHMNGSHASIPSGSIVIPDESVLYRSNGFDSRPDDPSKQMPVIPFLAQTPKGQIIYDQHNGNLGGKHLKKYGQHIKTFLQTWGSSGWAEKALNLLHSDDAIRHLRNYAYQNKEAKDHDPRAADSALNVIMGNRTGGDGVSDLVSGYKTYEEFRRNVLERSTQQDFKNYYKYSKLQPSGKYNLINPGQDIAGNLDNIIGELNRVINQSDNPGQAQQLAEKDIQELCIALTQLYQNHPDQFNWDKYASSMAALSDVKGLTGGSVVKTNSVAETDYDQQLDEEGFNLLKKYGHPVAKLMDFIAGLMTRSCNDSTNNKIVKKGKGVYESVTESRYGRNWTGTHGKAGSTKIMLGIRYAFRSDPIGEGTPLFSQVQKARYSRKLKKQRSGQDIAPETMWPQKGKEVDPRFQPAKAARVLEDITYWIGEASSTADFHTEIGRSKIKNQPWEEVIDQMRQRYPDIEGQLGGIYEPVNIDLRRLQEATKRALLAVVEETDTEAVFEDVSQGQTLIRSDNWAAEQDDSIIADFNASVATTGLEVLDAPSDEVIVQPPTEETLVDEAPVPPTVEEPVVPEEVIDQVSPEIKVPLESPQDRDKTQKLLSDTLNKAWKEENKKLEDLVEELDVEWRARRITGGEVEERLEEFDVGREPPEEEVELQLASGFVDIWEEKVKDGQEVPPRLWSLGGPTNFRQIRDPRGLGLVKIIVELGIAFPPHLKAAYEKLQSEQISGPEMPGPEIPETELGPDEAGLRESEDFLRGTDFGKGKSMPEEPETSFVGKRQTKRRLFRKRDNTGKMQQAEVIDTLIKVADLLDVGGEYIVADKVELLLHKVTSD